MPDANAVDLPSLYRDLARLASQIVAAEQDGEAGQGVPLLALLAARAAAYEKLEVLAATVEKALFVDERTAPLVARSSPRRKAEASTNGDAHRHVQLDLFVEKS
jgi:hypothetical protein